MWRIPTAALPICVRRAPSTVLQRSCSRCRELKELLKAKDEKEWKKNMLERSMEHIFDPPQIRELKAQIRSDLCRVINAMSPYEVLMNAPFHETPATSDLLDCDLKYERRRYS